MEEKNKADTSTKRLYIRGFLAGSTNLGFLFVVVWTVVEGLPPNGPGRDVLLLLLGALVALATGVNSYYFGSSQGSSDKTELLAEK